jgi:hypothetical protein
MHFRSIDPKLFAFSHGVFGVQLTHFAEHNALVGTTSVACSKFLHVSRSTTLSACVVAHALEISLSVRAMILDEVSMASTTLSIRTTRD